MGHMIPTCKTLNAFTGLILRNNKLLSDIVNVTTDLKYIFEKALEHI